MPRDQMNWMDKLIELGVTPAIGDQFSPLRADDLARIEEIVGQQLSEDYRSFLLQFGACDLEEYSVFPTEGGGIAPGTFFGRDLPDAITGSGERLPSLIVPINDDGAGNLTCISLRSDSFGQVFYQSHCAGWDDSLDDEDAAKFATLVRIAPDFASFICGLERE